MNPTRRRHALLPLLLGLACIPDTGPCLAGAADCACRTGNACDPGLSCQANVCRDPNQGGSAGSGTTSSDVGPSPRASTSEASTDAGTSTLSECSGQRLRIATFNVKSVGRQGSTEWNALGSVLRRIDADLVCLQEVDELETFDLRSLAASLDYGEPIHADLSPAIGGPLHNACMARMPVRRLGSYTARDLAQDPKANDVGRDILAVSLDLGDGCGLNAITVHAKSGQDDLDRFRRQVEFVRIAAAAAQLRTRHPGVALVVMGDFNENPDDPAIGQLFGGIPTGLPDSYRLGADVRFPMVYDPFATLAAARLVPVTATQEDSPAQGTWGLSPSSSGSQLDHLWVDGPMVEEAVVYFACRDDGVDEPPAGAWMPFAGDPLACSVSTQASDHSPIVADLILSGP